MLIGFSSRQFTYVSDYGYLSAFVFPDSAFFQFPVAGNGSGNMKNFAETLTVTLLKMNFIVINSMEI